MLDRVMTPTAEAIKAQLEDAFQKWDGAGGPKTKVRLAQLCADTVKGKKGAKPCTPQTVNGWFKQGRIDKYWLPVVSSILGARIGVLVELDGEHASDSVHGAFATLSSALVPLVGKDRKAAKELLEDFAMKPEEHRAIADQLEALLGGARNRLAA